MKVYGRQCEKCGEYLHYEQIQGIRLKREVDGKMIFQTFCPTCREYGEEEAK